ncbi:hypothetical protein [Thiolapillus sp.]|uniref:hypothetical protein n=1 Tax=Thiolapillus sp. TaxID=2017437 RepID=UPI003AF68CD1
MNDYSEPLDELYAMYISTKVYLDRYNDLLDPTFQKSMEKFSNEILSYFNSEIIILRHENQKKEKQWKKKKSDKKNPAR